MKIRRRSPPAGQTDWMKGGMARDLSLVIEGYWALRGYAVKTKLRKSGDNYYIRSDMVNGLPYGYDIGARHAAGH